MSVSRQEQERERERESGMYVHCMRHVELKAFIIMPTDNCSCKRFEQLVETQISQLGHRLNLMTCQSPQFSREILIWLKSIYDYVINYEAMLIEWEHGGLLDLECSQCKYTKNPENNSSNF